MRKRPVFLTIFLALAMSVSVAASSRVGNGVLPSLEYRCIPGEAVYSWCQSFEAGHALRVEDFREGPNFFIRALGDSDSKVAVAGILIIREGDALRYLLDEASQSEEQSYRWLSGHAEDARPLGVSPLFRDYLDVVSTDGRSLRIVVRMDLTNENSARIEIMEDEDVDYSEKSYLRAKRFPMTGVTD